MEHEAYLDMAAVEARHWWFRGRRRILEATIRRLKLRPGARILELGSGPAAISQCFPGLARLRRWR